MPAVPPFAASELSQLRGRRILGVAASFWEQKKRLPAFFFRQCFQCLATNENEGPLQEFGQASHF